MADVNEERLQNYLDAEKKALVSQEYQDGNSKNRRADLSSIREGTNALISTTATSRSRRVILRDL
jgi:hypothetical protein